MKFDSVEEIFAANDRVRESLIGLLAGISADDEELPSENGEWTVSKVVEHLAKVENSMMRICAKLLSKAKDKGLRADGTVRISKHFTQAVAKVKADGTKLNAPEVVQPKGGCPVSESIMLMNATREELKELRPMFEEFDGSAFSFPHPAFGDLTALDWLVLIGGHEARHLAQIERILAKRDAANA